MRGARLSTAACWLLGCATAIAIATATAATFSAASRWLPIVAWLQTLLLLTASVAVITHLRRSELAHQHVATGLTHKLRTALAQVRVYDEMLLLGRDTSEEERVAWLELIGREAERIGDTVESMLLVLNPSTRSPYPVRRDVDLRCLVEDALCIVSPDSILCAPRDSIFVRADSAALLHAVRVLLDGFEGALGVRGRLSVHLQSDRRMATLQVECEPPSNEGPDLDFVIAIASHVARGHGGSTVRTRGEKGPSFTIRLPLSSPSGRSGADPKQLAGSPPTD